MIDFEKKILGLTKSSSFTVPKRSQKYREKKKQRNFVDISSRVKSTQKRRKRRAGGDVSRTISELETFVRNYT